MRENEGTNERTATGHWKCLEMKKPMNIVLTDVGDLINERSTQHIGMWPINGVTSEEEDFMLKN